MKVDNQSRNTFIVCVTVMFCFVIGGAVAVTHYAKDPGTSLVLVSLMFGLLAPTIAGIAILFKSNQTQQTVQNVERNTEKMLNGALTKKIHDEVVPVIKTELARLLIEHSIVTHPSKTPSKTPSKKPKP